MCIIAIKPKNKENISLETLKTCFENNPHGAGIMYNEGENVKIIKGLMSWQQFQNEYNKIKNVEDKTIVYHFRISTTGRKNEKETHPFPLSCKNKKLQKTNTIAKIGVAHNGIIQDYNDSKILSDSQLFIKEVLFPFYKYDEQFFNKRNINKIINNLLGGDRLVLLLNNGEFKTYGNWQQENGFYFSNGTYKNYKYKTPKINDKYNTYNNYDYFNYYDNFDYYNYDYGTNKRGCSYGEYKPDILTDKIILETGEELKGEDLKDIVICYNEVYKIYEDDFEFLGFGEVVNL